MDFDKHTFSGISSFWCDSPLYTIQSKEEPNVLIKQLLVIDFIKGIMSSLIVLRTEYTKSY